MKTSPSLLRQPLHLPEAGMVWELGEESWGDHARRAPGLPPSHLTPHPAPPRSRGEDVAMMPIGQHLPNRDADWWRQHLFIAVQPYGPGRPG